MAEIIINDVKYTNVPNKKAGTKFASALTQSNIGMSQAVQDYVNSSYFYALINAIDINWDGIDIGENTYINTTSDLIKWIESKAGDIDLSSYATVAYVNQKFEDLIGGAPETLDTLKELADALQEDASLAYVTQALEGKANVNDVYTKTEVDNLIPAPVDLSGYVSYTQANSYYVAKEDMPDLNDYATTSYVTSELDKKADLSDIPSAPDLTNYVSYTDANSYYMTVEGSKQLIYGPKTFIGNKLINFRQGTSTDKLGFTLYNTDEKELGGLEWRPDTIDGKPLMSLQHYVNTANTSIIPQTYLGFRQTQGKWKYNLLAPIPTDVSRIEDISSSSDYKNFFMPLVFKNGSNKVYTNCNGLVDMAPIMDDYATVSHVISELDKKADLSDIPPAPDLTNYVSYTDANSYYMTVEGPKQLIYGSKTFIGDKKINFRQGTSNNKLGFTLYDVNEKEVGGLEWRPNTIGTRSLLSLQQYLGTGTKYEGISMGYLGFRLTEKTNSKYNLITPLPYHVNTIETINVGNDYRNFFFPLVFKNGNNKVYTECTGLVDMASLMPDLTNYVTYTDANSYYVAKEDMPDMSNYVTYTDANSYYVDINSYNALVARVEELASWIVSYHTPVIQDVSLWHTTDGSSVAGYLSNNGSERRYVNISDSTTHTINFDSNVNDIVMSVNGISTGITVNNTVWPYSIEYTPSMMTEGGNYSFGFSRNMDSSYNAFSSSFAFTVESSNS